MSTCQALVDEAARTVLARWAQRSGRTLQEQASAVDKVIAKAQAAGRTDQLPFVPSIRREYEELAEKRGAYVAVFNAALQRWALHQRLHGLETDASGAKAALAAIGLGGVKQRVTPSPLELVAFRMAATLRKLCRPGEPTPEVIREAVLVHRDWCGYAARVAAAT